MKNFILFYLKLNLVYWLTISIYFISDNDSDVISTIFIGLFIIVMTKFALVIALYEGQLLAIIYPILFCLLYVTYTAKFEARKLLSVIIFAILCYLEIQIMWGFY
ncbi:hypothetical protein [Psychrobacter sp. I-STPA6b]|uniref:hypothetical protein n=1 Tax=Psychrobacter sp. I-STPA6b TaxID=2585718 RepID=UPI001D0CAE6C|nr:hypothetical protein [Psychrobacter sp. I-STPA6b]